MTSDGPDPPERLLNMAHDGSDIVVPGRSLAWEGPHSGQPVPYKRID